MKRICNYAKVTSISDEFLQESNRDLNLERAQLRFQFVGGVGVGASALIANVDTSNSGSKLVDLSGIEGVSTAKKCKALLSQFERLAAASKETIAEALNCGVSDLTDDDIKSYRFPKFTMYSFTISELTEGRHNSVNNGERNYSTMSTTYLNEHNDPEEAKKVVFAQLKKRIDDGEYNYGELNEGEEE